MDNVDKIFKGQQEDEQFVVFFRQHWIVLVKDFLYFVLIISLPVLVFAIFGFKELQTLIRENTEMKLLAVIVYGFGTVFFHRFFLRLLNHFLNMGVLTNKRLLKHNRTLFFLDSLDAVDLDQIQNIERNETGILENLLRYGDIKIFLNASFAVMTFKHIKNDKYIFRCISRAKEITGQQYETSEFIPDERDHSTLMPHEQIHEQLNDPVTGHNSEITGKTTPFSIKHHPEG